MIQIETIEDRAYRLLAYGSETTPNIHAKSITIPVLPFDGGNDNRIVRSIWPSEYRDRDTDANSDSSYQSERSEEDDLSHNSYSYSYHNHNEERLDLDSNDRGRDRDRDREHEEYLGDRDHFVPLEDVNRSDQMLLGYCDDDFVHLPPRENHIRTTSTQKIMTDPATVAVAMTDTIGDTDTNVSAKDNVLIFDLGTFQSNEFDSAEADDILQPMYGPAISPVNSWGDDPLVLKTSDSGETDVSSVFSSSSTVTNTPRMLKLKTRKRLLEKFLREKSLENLKTQTREVNTSVSVSVNANGGGFEVLSGSVETSC